MLVTPITDFAQFTALRERWSVLLDRAETNTIFQSHAWHAAWLHSFGATGAITIGVIEEHGALVGIAPLFLAQRGGRCVLEFIGCGNQASDYADFIVERGRADVLHRLIDWALTDISAWDLLDLHNLPSHSTHRPLLEQRLRSASAFLVSKVCCEAPTRLLGDPQADRELVNKKSLKRHANYFKRSGALVCKHTSDPDEILPRLEAFFAQHIARRAGAAGESLFLKQENRAFYAQLVAVHGNSPWLRFAVVEWNGSPIAFHFGFMYANRFVWYKPSFDIALEKHSPGEVLLKFLFEEAIAAGCAEFDFTVGGEGFKHRFANCIRTNHRIRVYRSRWDYAIACCRGWVGNALRRLRGGSTGLAQTR